MNTILMKYILSDMNKKNFSPDKLVPKGFSFSQIGEALYELINNGYVSADNEIFTITNKGIDFLRKTKPYNEILPLIEYKCEQLSIDDIYIPNYNKGEYKEIEN